MKQSIKPGIVLASGETIYPTGFEYLLSFAIRGCQWAIDALPEAIENYTRQDINNWNGSGI